MRAKDENAKYMYAVYETPLIGNIGDITNGETELDMKPYVDVGVLLKNDIPANSAISEVYIRVKGQKGKDLEENLVKEVRFYYDKLGINNPLLEVINKSRSDWHAKIISHSSRDELIVVIPMVNNGVELSFEKKSHFRILFSKGKDLDSFVDRVEMGVTYHPVDQDKMPNLYSKNGGFGDTGLYEIDQLMPRSIRENMTWGKPVKSNKTEKNVIVLIHGWNPNSYGNPYAPTSKSVASIPPSILDIDGEDKAYTTYGFLDLTNNLIANREISQIPDKPVVLHYYWPLDAASGGKMSLDASDNANASRNAGVAHGLKLGVVLLDKFPNLENVQFIAHSAGNWVAHRAGAYLRSQKGTSIYLQQTALDPFVNDRDKLLGDARETDRETTEGELYPLRLADINHLAAMEMTSEWFDYTENIYTKDHPFIELEYSLLSGFYTKFSFDSDTFNRWTSGPLEGWTLRDYSIDEISNSFYEKWMDAHAGPISWYASTVKDNSTEAYLDPRWPTPPYAYMGFPESIWAELYKGLPQNTPLDLMFVIDTSGSMGDDIEAVKTRMTEIIESTDTNAKDVRFGIVEFKDLRSDNPAVRTVISLTSDTAAVINAVNTMSAGGGRDTGESQLSGIVHAMDGNAGLWRRSPARKSMIVMTDEPANDPEFQTGYTAQQIINKANNGDFALEIEDLQEAPLLLKSSAAKDVVSSSDPEAVAEETTEPEKIQLFGIFIGSDSSARVDLQKLASGTGGKVFAAADASEVVDAIIEIIDVIGGGGSLVTVKSTGDIALNAQTGLYEQTVTFENLSGDEVTGFRVFVEGLPAGVTLQNAHGTADGKTYVDYRQTVGVDGEVSFALEYHNPARTAFDPPTFTVVPAGDAFPDPDDSLALSLNPRLTFEADRSVLIEFDTQGDKEYLIQYSFNLTDWKTVPSAITGTGSKVQWIDSGAPKTECHPKDCPSRYYRLIERTPAN